MESNRLMKSCTIGWNDHPLRALKTKTKNQKQGRGHRPQPRLRQTTKGDAARTLSAGSSAAGAGTGPRFPARAAGQPAPAGGPYLGLGGSLIRSLRGSLRQRRLGGPDRPPAAEPERLCSPPATHRPRPDRPAIPARRTLKAGPRTRA